MTLDINYIITVTIEFLNTLVIRLKATRFYLQSNLKKKKNFNSRVIIILQINVNEGYFRSPSVNDSELNNVSYFSIHYVLCVYETMMTVILLLCLLNTR